LRWGGDAAVIPRALHRRFQEASGTSPGAWLLAERMARARELLEGATLPIEDVAAACGFGTAATMRHHFRTTLGVSPAAYRDRFRAPA
jgi:AraC family transcriptional activator FtrA